MPWNSLPSGNKETTRAKYGKIENTIYVQRMVP